MTHRAGGSAFGLSGCTSTTHHHGSSVPSSGSNVPNTGDFIGGESQGDRISRIVRFGPNEAELAEARAIDAYRERMRPIREAQERDRQAREDFERAYGTDEYRSWVAQRRAENRTRVNVSSQHAQLRREQIEADRRDFTRRLQQQIDMLNECIPESQVGGQSNPDGTTEELFDEARLNACMDRNFANGIPKIQLKVEVSNRDEARRVCQQLIDASVESKSRVAAAATAVGISSVCPGNWMYLPCIATSAVIAFKLAKNLARAEAEASDVCREAKRE